MFGMGPASWALTCNDVFSRSLVFERLAKTAPLTQQEALYQSAEIKQHGFVFDLKDQLAQESLSSFILERDGVYPFLINKEGIVVIDHRLPLQTWTLNTPFLGTHRGLFQKLKSLAQHAQEIIFAGEIRAVGNKVTQISDASVNFYRKFSAKSRDEERLGWPLFVEQNKKRALLAREVLMQMRLIDHKTTINLVDGDSSPITDVERRRSYVQSDKTSRFEISCRANPDCWQTFEKIQKHVVFLVQNGGEKFLVDQARDLLQKDALKATNILMHMSLILRQGLIDVMATESTLSQREEFLRTYRQLSEDLDFFFPL
jgi:hypothetical protein